MTTRVTTPPETSLLLRILDQAFERKAWHGPTLLGSLRGVDAAQAVWRPAPDRHNVWELVLHAAYWKYAVRRRLTGEARGSFPREGSNFPTLPETRGEKEWKADVALLRDSHRALRDVVATFPPDRLGEPLPPKRQWDAASVIYGVAAHDTYHTGQIQLLKRLRAGA